MSESEVPKQTAFEQWADETADALVNGPPQAREAWADVVSGSIRTVSPDMLSLSIDGNGSVTDATFEVSASDLRRLLLRVKIGLVQARSLEARHVGSELMIRSGTNPISAGLWDRSARLEKFGLELAKKGTKDHGKKENSDSAADPEVAAG